MLGLGLLFHGWWWNVASGLATADWFPAYAKLWREGQMPYRDFYLFAPPGHMLEHVVLQSIFGEGMLVGRVAGLVQRLVMMLVMFFWLRCFFSERAAVISAVVSFAVYANDPPDALNYMNHSAVFYALVAGWAGTEAWRRGSLGWALGAGIAAMAGVWTKQTTGPAALVLVGMGWVMGAWKEAEWKRFWRLGWAYAGGVLLVAVPMVVWLMKAGIWGDFLDQVIVRGPSSKGNLWQLVTRPFANVGGNILHGVGGVVGLGMVIGLWRTGWVERRARTGGVAGLGVLVGMVILFGVIFSWSLHRLGLSEAEEQVYSAGHSLLYWVVVIAWWFLWGLGGLIWLGRIRLSEGWWVMWVFGVGMFPVAAVSFPIYLLMAVPTLAVALAMWVDWLGELRWWRALVMMVVLGLMGIAVFNKLLMPFGFMRWIEPSVWEPRAERMPRGFEGLRLADFTARTIESMQQHLQEAPDGEPVMAFPFFPGLYLTTDRWPAGRALVYWLDVTPDYVLEMEVEAMKQRPPARVVALQMSEKIWMNFEEMFRAAHQSPPSREMRRMFMMWWKQDPGAMRLRVPGTRYPLDFFSVETRSVEEREGQAAQ